MNAVDFNQRSALHHALLCDRAKVPKLLIIDGAHLAATENHGWTPIWMVISGHIVGASEVLHMLLRRKFGVDVVDSSSGNTLLHVAATRDNLKDEKALLDAKAKPDTKNNRGDTLLITAACLCKGAVRLVSMFAE